MAMTTRNDVNLSLAAKGKPVTLVRGEGYHYFIYDRPDLNVFETHSVYCCYFSQMAPAEWLKEGLEFASRVEQERGIPTNGVDKPANAGENTLVQ